MMRIDAVRGVARDVAAVVGYLRAGPSGKGRDLARPAREAGPRGAPASRCQGMCSVCGEATAPFAEARILDRHEIRYFRCPACGFIQTEEPHWLEEAYSEAINETDVGLVERNQRLSSVTRDLVLAFFDAGGRFLDYGGGYGLLVRMMRDMGFEFLWHDEFCSNLFAKRCEADLTSDAGYELVTAFEVFEHLPRPIEAVDRMLGFSDSILFTTTLVPERVPRPGEWWYYGLEHGQHVSLYTRRSLEVIAESRGLAFHTDGASLHLITARPISDRMFQIVLGRRYGRLWRRALERRAPRRSLLEEDYRRIAGRGLE